ncbi:MAG: hypothetical protein JWO22_3845 [Frankiales bacterium]|nr:hypothetical protein [Frankiales bacterium]
MNDDDLPDSALWDALLGPGTHDELAGEGAALAAFRAAQPSRRRGIHRLGVVGGAGVAIFLAAGAGVAAAYTNHLPAPVQDAIAAVPGMGVPTHHASAARTAAHRRVPIAHPSPSSSSRVVAVPVPGSSPNPTATPGVVATAQPSTVTSAAPPAAPSAGASPSPAPSPRLTEALSATTVAVHQDVVVTGRLVRSDKPMANRTVYLARQYPGQDGWTRIGQGTTDARGRVQITASGLTRNLGLRLAGGGVLSGMRKVTVLPAVAVKVTVPSAGRRKLNVTTDGAASGDTVQLLRLDGSTWKVIGSHELDAHAASAFTVPAAPSGQRVRYRVRVLATARHGVGLHATTLSSP